MLPKPLLGGEVNSFMSQNLATAYGWFGNSVERVPLSDLAPDVTALSMTDGAVAALLRTSKAAGA